MKNFCVLPWFGREIGHDGHETYCCHLAGHYDINKIRETMKKGERPVECQKCWNLEDQNLPSDRQIKNRRLSISSGRSLDLLKQDAIANQEKIMLLKLSASATCNSTCVTCSSFHSSAWGALNRKITPTSSARNYKTIDLDKLEPKIDFQNLVGLILLGGEPLYEKRNLEILEHILSLGNDRVYLSIVTNGSMKLNSVWKQTLSKFRNLNLHVSIDGTERVFEYVRYPLSWDLLLENISFFRQITDSVSSSYTLSNLNLLYHRDTINWFKEQKISFWMNPVSWPFYFSPDALPADVKSLVADHMLDMDPQHRYALNHSERTERSYAEFRRQIKTQDKAKGIHMRDYLPELYQLLDLDY